MEDFQRDAVRIIRIAVIVAELDIASSEIQPVIFLDNPSVNRALDTAGMDIVLLHFQAGVSDGDVGCPVFIHVG